MKCFDYKCLDCNYEWEWFDYEPIPMDCPKCEASNVLRLFPMPRLQEKRQPYDYIGKHRTDDPIKGVVPKNYKGGKGG
jgi:hypothetical protein